MAFLKIYWILKNKQNIPNRNNFITYFLVNIPYLKMLFCDKRNIDTPNETIPPKN